jgi:cation-transporting ATPase E/undecaprenyl-diphosphatase
MRDLLAWLLSRDAPRWFLLSAAVLVLGGAWLFLGILEDVVNRDPLVELDARIHQGLLALRTPGGDSVFVVVTELGDVQVVVPVTVAVLGWLIAHRFWRTALYWTAAVGVAEALAKSIKLSLHRPRPSTPYPGIEQFSFPSGHATLSVVIYGFLAFLLSIHASHRVRVVIISATALLVGSIALSRIYLGAHWMSDVLGGLSIGTAWIAVLAVAYMYQRPEALDSRKLAVIYLATLAIAATIHVTSSHGADLLRYAPVRAGIG